MSVTLESDESERRIYRSTSTTLNRPSEGVGVREKKKRVIGDREGVKDPKDPRGYRTKGVCFRR